MKNLLTTLVFLSYLLNVGYSQSLSIEITLLDTKYNDCKKLYAQYSNHSTQNNNLNCVNFLTGKCLKTNKKSPLVVDFSLAGSWGDDRVLVFDNTYKEFIDNSILVPLPRFLAIELEQITHKEIKKIIRVNSNQTIPELQLEHLTSMASSAVHFNDYLVDYHEINHSKHYKFLVEINDGINQRKFSTNSNSGYTLWSDDNNNLFRNIVLSELIIDLLPKNLHKRVLQPSCIMDNYIMYLYSQNNQN